MKVELTEEQIRDAVRSVVDEEMPEAVRDAVQVHANTIIKEAVDERIGRVVDEMLLNEQFVVGRTHGHASLDGLVKSAVRSYLDERVYLYSDTNSLPSVRFARSSSQHSEPTRLEAFLRYTVEKFCDEHLAEKLSGTVADFLQKRGGIEAIARLEMAKLLKEKFKL
jgi:hypothetical protein